MLPFRVKCKTFPKIFDTKYFDHDRTYSREKMVEFVGEVSNEVFDALMEAEQKGSTAALDALAVDHFYEILGLAISNSQYDTICSDTIKRVLHCDDLPDGGQALYGALVKNMLMLRLFTKAVMKPTQEFLPTKHLMQSLRNTVSVSYAHMNG